jgi:hypothetical protein
VVENIKSFSNIFSKNVDLSFKKNYELALELLKLGLKFEDLEVRKNTTSLLKR